MNMLIVSFTENKKRVLGWLLTSVLLVLLFVNSRPFNQNYHDQIVHHVAELSRYNSEQGELVLKQHFHLLNNFDALVSMSGQLQGELHGLRDSDALHALSDEPAIMAAFKKMEARMLLEQSMLERFKSSNAVLRNSMLFLPHTVDELLNTMPPAVARRVGTPLRRLRQDVVTISADASALDFVSLQDDLDEFRRVVATLPSGERASLELVGRHFEQVMRLEAEASKLMRELTLSGKRDGISDEFAETFDAFYAREVRRSRRYLMLLFAVALAMMSYATYAFYHMRRLNERTQRALNEVRNQKVALDEHAIVTVIDMQGHITYVNQSLVAVSGYWQEELLGRDYRRIYSGDPDDEVLRDMQATLLRGQVWHGQMLNRAKDGHPYWVEATAVPFMDATGSTYQHVLICTDITAQKEAEHEAMLAREAAEAASKAKGDFLAVMSHEIRTPMNGIIGMTDLALDTDLSDIQRQYLSLVKSSADALLVIINDILDFSKVEAGKMVLEQVPFDIRELSDATTRLLAVRAAEKGVAVVARLDDGIPAVLLGDPGRLRQVLTNLLGNAIKFSRQGEVTLRMRLLGRSGNKARLRIEVADQGIGIPAEKQVSIFEAFSQADASVTRQYGGTGLGLAIASQLVTAMGGQLGVESEVGRGSVFGFEVEFSISDAALVESGAMVSHPSLPTAMMGMNVLLAEDNAVNQKLAITLLERWGNRVTLANNGREAVELSREQSFDVILMDIQMPEMGGFEATRLIREREARSGRYTPIVAMTANAASEDRQRCLDAGMDDYIAKPIAAAQLLALLQGRSAMAHQAVAPIADSSAPFDYAEAITRADPDVVESIGQAFLDSCDQTLDEIVSAIAANDDKTLSRGAHTLRGLAGYFNAARIETLSRQLEGISERGDWSQASGISRHLQGEVALLKTALAAHLANSR
ncbi:MAG TPA: DAHL domain-containing protein [Gallionella sp.]|nr:DAHL domain-containing protein [Gallionella sp.]